MIFDHELFKDIISFSSFIISMFLLVIHIKNRCIQLQSFWISKDLYRSGFIDLIHVSSKQLNDRVILKLVVFNPGSVSAVIKSFSVFREDYSRNFLLRFFGKKEWTEVHGARWWPTNNADDHSIKYLADEYRNLYIEEQRDILVSLPGLIDRNRYSFEIQTNLGWCRHETTIDGIATYFSHSFHQGAYK